MSILGSITINHVTVIGSGVMGSAIAAQIANSGTPVLLLDVVPGAAAASIERMLKTEPAPFMHPKFAKLIIPGNLPDDLSKIAKSDWIIEAIVENPKIKSDLYTQLNTVRHKDSIVSSNTSTIPLSKLIEGQGDKFVEDFMITHFFNPPRYMRLLEMVWSPPIYVPGGKHLCTKVEKFFAVQEFVDKKLGKTVVLCNDTPGFIANRIGAFWIQTAINAAYDLGMTVEEADAVLSKPFGFPKTGVFGLVDLVGLDLMPLINKSLCATLPENDFFKIAAARQHPVINQMIADGYTGRKGKGGFYRLENKVKMAVDLTTGAVRKAEKVSFESIEQKDLKALMTHPDKGGQYARAVMIPTLEYAFSLLNVVSNNPNDIDTAMKLGYNWKYGPYELMEKIGDNKYNWQFRPPIVRQEGVLLLSDIKKVSKPVKKNASAALWDIGDKVLCLEFTSKMNTIDPQIFEMVKSAIELCSGSIGKDLYKPGLKQFDALVIYNEGENFSVGANLGLAMFLYNTGLGHQVEDVVKQGQECMISLRDAPFPVVAAPFGMVLGGGCEFVLHSNYVQAHAETYMGLVEVGVGLLPAWGGTKELLHRHMADKKRPFGSIPAIGKAFETIAMAKVSKSAADALDLKFLRETDGITMNRDRLLFDAKQAALRLVKTDELTKPLPKLSLPGPSGKFALELVVKGMRLLGKVSDHDYTVSMAVARVLTGGESDITDRMEEQELLGLERREFMSLFNDPKTLDRIDYMLANGKPLRN